MVLNRDTPGRRCAARAQLLRALMGPNYLSGECHVLRHVSMRRRGSLAPECPGNSGHGRAISSFCTAHVPVHVKGSPRTHTAPVELLVGRAYKLEREVITVSQGRCHQQQTMLRGDLHDVSRQHTSCLFVPKSYLGRRSEAVAPHSRTRAGFRAKERERVVPPSFASAPSPGPHLRARE